jgi:hypothetical protein
MVWKRSSVRSRLAPPTTYVLPRQHCGHLCGHLRRAPADWQEPGDAESEPVDIEDERVTLKYAIAVLGAPLDALDLVTP